MSYVFALTVVCAFFFGLGVYQVNRDTTYETKWGAMIFIGGLGMLGTLLIDLLWAAYTFSTFFMALARTY